GGEGPRTTRGLAPWTAGAGDRPAAARRTRRGGRPAATPRCPAPRSRVPRSPGRAAPPGDVEVGGQQPLIRGPGHDLGPGWGGKRQAGEEANPRRLDITPVSVHWPGSTLEA